MMPNQIKEKGILAKLLEKGIELLLRKECKKISKIEINIVASSIQIIQGLIRKINIMAEEINYKDLLFDKFELEANNIKIIFNIINKELQLKNNFTIKFKLSLSADSLKTVLLSNKWNWIGDMISKEILNKAKLEDIKLKNDQILIKTSKDNNIITEEANGDINTENGDLYLRNKANNKSIKIPIEDKVFIRNVNIENNLINIFAKSSISF